MTSKRSTEIALSNFSALYVSFFLPIFVCTIHKFFYLFKQCRQLLENIIQDILAFVINKINVTTTTITNVIDDVFKLVTLQKTVKEVNKIRVGTRNILSWSEQRREIISEMSKKEIDICCITETKKKGMGAHQTGDYILIYSGVAENKTANAGVGVLFHKKFKPHIKNYDCLNERILQTVLQIGDKYIHIFCVYAPRIRWPLIGAKDFYKQLQQQLNEIPSDHYYIILGDLNTFFEEAANQNGALLTDFCKRNNLRIKRSKRQVQKLVQDYVLTDEKFTIDNIIKVRAVNTTDTKSDQILLLCDITMK